MRTPSPYRLAAAALGTMGAGVVALNLEDADESRVLGIFLLVLGTVLAIGRETAARLAGLEMTWAVVLSLAGGEATVRWQNELAQQNFEARLVRFVDDPELRYVLQPHRQHGLGITNSRGMVDVERDEAHPPDLVRVACLGDSVGADFGVPHGNACAVLEDRLREARNGRPTEVLNFSVPGYNTLQEARALETLAAPFAPDAIVVLYVVNDPFPDLAISNYLPGHLKFEHLLYDATHLALARLLGGGDDPWDGGLQALYERARAWDGVVVRGFDRIGAFARERGDLPVVVAVWPLFLPQYGVPFYGIYDRVVREAERHGFSGIDLRTAAFHDVEVSELLKPERDLVHPNARAHALVADAIARALVEARPDLVER